MNIASTLFNVRKEIKKDLYTTLKKLSLLGNKNIELSRIDFNDNTLEILLKAKKDFNLTFVASQIKFRKIVKYFDKIVNFHKQIDCNVIEIACIPINCMNGNEKNLLIFIEKVNSIYKRLKVHNLILAYHHHSYEFKKFGYRFGFEIINDLFDKNIKYIFDLYWLKNSNINSLEFLNKYQNRYIGIHLRDYKYEKNILVNTPIGQGINDIKEVMDYIKDKDIYASIELKSDDPFKDLEISLNYLKISKLL